VFAICDRVTVLRDGRTEKTLVTAQTTPDEIVRLMVGRDVGGAERSRASSALTDEPPVLEVNELSVHRPRMHRSLADESGRYAVEHVSFSVKRGEIVAVCGAMGSGRTALLSALFGSAHSGTSGRASLCGAPLKLDSALSAIESGIAFVPEDRKGRGLVLGMTVAENLALPSLASAQAMGAGARLGYVDPVSESELAKKRIAALRIRGAADAPVQTLSGGNQQKVVLGKWLEHPPKLLLLDEPTRGVDVGAREEIYTILRRLAADGVAILFASSDLSEVLRLADRVLVLRLGTLVGELDAATASEEAIVQLSTRAAMHPLSEPPKTTTLSS
jgi:ABC-type sugar transport system ATPase subunit